MEGQGIRGEMVQINWYQLGVQVLSRFPLRFAVFYQSDMFCTLSHMQFYSSLSVSEVLLLVVTRSCRV